MNRREALCVLATGSAVGALTGGVVVMAAPPSAAEASADPCLAFVQQWSAVQDECNRLSLHDDADFYEREVVPFEEVATYGTIPAATTPQGAAAALRKAMAFGDMQQQDANLIRAALAFLEAGA